MGFTINRIGFDNGGDLANSIITDLADNGFELTWVNEGTISDPTISATKAILKSTATSNTLNAEQPFNIAVFGPASGDTDSSVYFVMGAPETLPDEYPSTIGGFWDKLNGKLTLVSHDAFQQPNSHAYQMTITARGLAIVTYHETEISDDHTYGFVCAQRPVNPVNGSELVTGEAPLLIIAKSYHDPSTYTSVVRTKSQTKAWNYKSAHETGGFTGRWANTSVQENGTYTMAFPYGLRAFSGHYMEEMDLICKGRADDFLFDQGVQVTVYGEGTERIYNTLSACGTGSTASRIMVLTQGGGI